MRPTLQAHITGLVGGAEDGPRDRGWNDATAIRLSVSLMHYLIPGLLTPALHYAAA